MSKNANHKGELYGLCTFTRFPLPLEHPEVNITPSKAFSVVYSEIPQYLTVTHETGIIAGETSFIVTADAGSFIALTVNNEIIGTAEGTGSPVSISIEAQMPGDMILVTVTKQNYYRYESYVTVIPPEGPYIIYNDIAIDDANGNNNGIMETGESILASITMKNIGIEEGVGISVSISTDDEYISLSDDTEDYGTISAGATSSMPNGFAWDVANNIPDLHDVMFTIESTNGTDVWTSTMNITGHAPLLSNGAMTIDDIEQGNGNGSLDPGETVNLIVNTYNGGSATAVNTVGSLMSNSPYVTINNSEFIIGDIESETNGTAIFNVTISAGTPLASVIDFGYYAESGEYNIEYTYSRAVGLILEDWESGDMSQFDWETGGNLDWSISTSNPYEGQYCNKSGSISDQQASWLSITYEVFADDTISFYAMVSSEVAYDYLRFYIDGDMMMNWSGEEEWQRVTIPVSEGTHIFKWEYTKDYSVSGGEDCGRVDYIVLPVPPITSAFAGVDTDYCETDIMQCEGSATYCDSTRWTTSGTGTFDDDLIFTPIYQPSTDDINAGSVVLTFTGFGPTETVSDDVTFTIGKTPTAFAGTEAAICSNEDYYNNIAIAENYNSIEWTTLGDGTFDDSSVVNSTYTPGPTDVENGLTSLVLTVVGTEACGTVTDQLELTIFDATTAYAGEDADICPGLSYTLSDASALNYESIEWTTSGDGTFDDATSQNPIYTPGENDKVSKEVTLTLTAISETVCPTIIDEMLLTLYCTDIDDINSKNRISLYPNPNDGRFTLKLESVSNEYVDVVIYSPIGKLVYKKSDLLPGENYSSMIDLDVLPGIYTIKIEGNNTHITKKIIIK